MNIFTLLSNVKTAEPQYMLIPNNDSYNSYLISGVPTGSDWTMTLNGEPGSELPTGSFSYGGQAPVPVQPIMSGEGGMPTGQPAMIGQGMMSNPAVGTDGMAAPTSSVTGSVFDGQMPAAGSSSQTTSGTSSSGSSSKDSKTSSSSSSKSKDKKDSDKKKNNAKAVGLLAGVVGIALCFLAA